MTIPFGRVMKGSPRFHFALPFRWGELGASFPEPPFCFYNPCRSLSRQVWGGAPRLGRPSRSRRLSSCSSDVTACRRVGEDFLFQGGVGQKVKGLEAEVESSNHQVVKRIKISNRQLVQKSKCQPVQLSKSPRVKMSTCPKVESSNRQFVQLIVHTMFNSLRTERRLK